MLFRKRTAMNLLTFLATAAASFVLVIGRRWAVKSVAEIYDQGKMGTNQCGTCVLPLISKARIQRTWGKDWSTHSMIRDDRESHV